ncbi:MAG: hypothetical protein L0211_23685, partial [Planctomycetaceae bacterium]|nr:hypothetical protein [Planctomycetaceae bacterium]
MRAVSWTTCMWPGLTALWLRGRWGGLAVAIAFGLAVQFALLRTFAPSAMPDVLVAGASSQATWVCVLGFWIVGFWLNRRELLPAKAAVDPDLDGWLRDAQTEYLKGHWIEAETLVARLLARRPDDVEGRLLLASVQRRTRRLAEARRTLEQLSENEFAGRWTWEIHAEQQRMAEIEQGTS